MKGFSAEPGERARARQIDLARLAPIIRAADIGEHIARPVLDHDDGECRRRRRNRRAPAPPGVRPRPACGASMVVTMRARFARLHQTLRQMRRGQRHGLARERHAFAHRDARHRRCVTTPSLHHAAQHLVAALQRRAMAWRSGRCFTGDCGSATSSALSARSSAARLLAEIGQRGGAHAFQIAAERRQRQIERQDLVLGIALFQLHRAHHLEQLAADAVAVRLQQPRHLHGQRRAAADTMWPARANWNAARTSAERIDAPMAVETLSS